jgi:hypothetical protein
MFRFSGKIYSNFVFMLFFGVLGLTLWGCGQPAMDPNSPIGKEAIEDQTNNYLTTGDCTDAIATILPLYNSSNTDNEVRMLTASAYACNAGVNFFSTITNIGTDATTLSSGNFFGYFAQLFPSTVADKVVESAGYAMNVLMTVIPAGTVIIGSDSLNATSDNPGSLNFNDRTGDSNLYMLMVGMAAIGGSESRYGNPNASFNPQNSPPLPFNDNVTKMTDQGCIYAAGLLNFFDAIVPAAEALPTSASSAINQINNFTIDGVPVSFDTLFDAACNYGCTGSLPSGADIIVLNPTGKWSATGCSIVAGCGGCPKYLRDYTQCHPNVANDPGACAAAGLANFVNASLAAWN